VRLAVAVRRRPAMRGPATRLPREEGVCRECVTVRVMLRMGKLTFVLVLFARAGSRRVLCIMGAVTPGREFVVGVFDV